MIQQAKLIWPKKRTTDNYMPIRCDWQAITQLPYITCDPYRPDIITIEANFWGRLAVAVHGSSMTYYFSPTSPQEFGQVVAHYISQWTGKPIEEAHAPRLFDALEAIATTEPDQATNHSQLTALFIAIARIAIEEVQQRAAHHHYQKEICA